MELGSEMDNSEIEDIIKEQKPEDCALLIYTVSGWGSRPIVGDDNSPADETVHQGSVGP